MHPTHTMGKTKPYLPYQIGSLIRINPSRFAAVHTDLFERYAYRI